MAGVGEELPEAVSKAILQGNMDIIEAWVTQAERDYAKLNVVDSLHGQTALDFAIVAGHSDIVSYLITQGVDVQYPHVKHQGRSTLELAQGLLEDAKGAKKEPLQKIVKQLKQAIHKKPNPKPKM